MLGCLASGPQFHSATTVHTPPGVTGMIGFDIACDSAGSGPRMQGYLVNDLCEPITAEKKQSDFALAA